MDSIGAEGRTKMKTPAEGRSCLVHALFIKSDIGERFSQTEAYETKLYNCLEKKKRKKVHFTMLQCKAICFFYNNLVKMCYSTIHLNRVFFSTHGKAALQRHGCSLSAAPC